MKHKLVYKLSIKTQYIVNIMTNYIQTTHIAKRETLQTICRTSKIYILQEVVSDIEKNHYKHKIQKLKRLFLLPQYIDIFVC